MEHHPKTLIVIAGPTASGKTSLSVQVAEALNCAILSADSRQFFNEMSIGTAKPTPEEMKHIPHYFINSLSIEEEYTSGQFERDALVVLQNEFKTKDYALLVGGSGLYIDAVCKGMDNLPKNASIRADLNQLLAQDKFTELQCELKEKDADYYAKIDIHNPHRVIRALEVIRSSGKKMSELQTKTVSERPFSVMYFGISHPREILYNRINQRVVSMFENGLVEEVKQLLPYKHKQALNTVGYKEVIGYLEGKCTLQEAIAMVQQNTRRYAKRQLTWFNREKNMYWLDGEKQATWASCLLEKL